MKALWNSPKARKFILPAIAITISAILIGLLLLITGSLIAAVVIYLALIWLLLRTIGGFVMYPGNFFYTRADIQIRLSKELSSKMFNCFNALHCFSNYLSERNFSPSNRFQVRFSVSGLIKSGIGMLEMYESTLSSRKVQLLSKFRDLREILEKKQEDKANLMEMLANVRRIRTISEQDMEGYQAKFIKMDDVIKDISKIIESYVPPSGLLAYLRFMAFEENLYEMRFGFYNWGLQYNYDKFMVSTPNKDSLQTAIIHYQLDRQDKDIEPKGTVLFCNPNGVFIQFFGDHDYISNYLALGYRVVLWNYRGYGQSTGSPSLRRSQEDAYSVYRFYREKGYRIDIVHGYSIGGAAAVGLLEKISVNEEQYPEDKVQVLIVDRSFSSLGEISIQFGKAANILAKVLFFSENIDFSLQFQQSQCKKLLICDTLDEIISDRASVKYAIAKRRQSQEKGGNYLYDEDVEKGELNEEIGSLGDLEEACRVFQETLGRLLDKRGKRGEGKQLEFLAEQQRETSMATACSLDHENYDFLVHLLDTVDGGGIRLFSTNKLIESRQKNPLSFHHICESYILGLVFYGSYIPLQPILHSPDRIKAQTISKIEKLLQALSVKYGIGQQGNEVRYQTENSPLYIYKNMYAVYSKLLHLIVSHYGKEWFALHGSLLPTSNGHNSSLTLLERRTLNAFLSHSLPPVPPPAPA